MYSNNLTIDLYNANQGLKICPKRRGGYYLPVQQTGPPVYYKLIRIM